MRAREQPLARRVRRKADFCESRSLLGDRRFVAESLLHDGVDLGPFVEVGRAVFLAELYVPGVLLVEVVPRGEPERSRGVGVFLVDRIPALLDHLAVLVAVAIRRLAPLVPAAPRQLAGQ